MNLRAESSRTKLGGRPFGFDERHCESGRESNAK